MINDSGEKDTSFMMEDIAALRDHLNLDTKIIHVCSFYAATEEAKAQIFKEVIEQYNDCIILTTDCLSIIEFPEALYNDPFEGVRDPNKKDIDVPAIKARDKKLLESVGFRDINFYVNYEFKNAYMYQNEVAKPLFDYLDGKR